MNIKAQIMQALMSGQDPAEALRLSLLKKMSSEGTTEKLDNMISSLKQILDYKLITNNSNPYNDLDSMLSDYDHIEDIYDDYPHLKGQISPLIKLIETRDKIKID